MRIMLDAGHDGHRNQSPVNKSYYESDFAWKLQTYLKEELEKYGIEVGTTRKSQNEVMDVVVRGKKAKGYDLFISLHSNACGTESVDRPVGIFLAKDDTTGIDEVSEQISVLLANLVHDVIGTKDKARAYSKLAGYDRNGNGITTDDDYYGVLYGCHSVKVAGLILEHSFHTNKHTADWLLVDDNVRKLAVEESKAIANYYGLGKQKTEVEYNEVAKTESKTVIHTVSKGDNLTYIAKKYNTTVDEIVALNPCIVKKSVIVVGWKLTIPTNTESKKVEEKIITYTVTKGDSLSKIANAYTKAGHKVTWSQIAKANNIVNPLKLQIGRVLIIP